MEPQEFCLISIRKPLNKRDNESRGFLYHYGHFLLDFALPFYKHYCNGNIKKLLLPPDSMFGTMSPISKLIYPDVDIQPIKGDNNKPKLQLIGYCRLDIHIGELKQEVSLFHQYVVSKANELIVSHMDKKWPRILLIQRGRAALFRGHANGITRRSIHNHNQLKTAIEDKYKDFSNIVLENIPFFEQVLLFHNADIIIGQYGSGLVNILWSKPTTKCITITTPRLDKDLVFINCCLARDVQYIPVYCNPRGNAWIVDVGKILNIINENYKNTIPSDVEN